MFISQVTPDVSTIISTSTPKATAAEQSPFFNADLTTSTTSNSSPNAPPPSTPDPLTEVQGDQHKRTFEPFRGTLETQGTFKPDRAKVLPTFNTGNNNRLTSSTQEFFRSILKENPGFAVSEHHDCLNAPNFMKEQMSFFKDQNVQRLYLEMFESKHQPLLDQFMAEKGNEGPASKRVKDYIQTQWGGHSPGRTEALFDMMCAAKDKGISLRGIDLFYFNPKDANVHRNNNMAQVIRQANQDLPADAKYVVYTGSGHNIPGEDSNGPPGVSKMLGIPDIELSTPWKQPLGIRLGSTASGHDYKMLLPLDPQQKKSPQYDREDVAFPEVLQDKPEDTPTARQNKEFCRNLFFNWGINFQNSWDDQIRMLRHEWGF